jgi:6-phosphogluconolactonase (cycloisomerase 2 family)
VLYTASATHVEAYAVDPARGTPRLVAQVAYAGADRLPLAVDPAGRFVYAVSPEEVHAFRTAADGRLQDYGRVAPGGTHVLTLRAR